MRNKLLWVHGWGTSSAVWQKVIAELTEYEHHVVSFAGCESVVDFHTVIRQKVAELSEDEELDTGSSGTVSVASSVTRLTVVGWSMGGMLALEVLGELLAEMPARMPGAGMSVNLVLVSASLRFVSADRKLGWPVRVLSRMRSRLESDPEETLSSFREAMFTEAERLELMGLERAGGGVDFLQGTDFTQAGLRAGLSYLEDVDLHETWARVVESARVRVLWMHGAEDAICPIGGVPGLAGAVSRDYSRVVLDGRGHALFWTERELFCKELRWFLSED